MMMSMLSAAGMDILVDNHRPGDVSNPRGYFEYEPVLSSKNSVEWVPLAQGKAVKVIYALLDSLPPDFYYRVIFMMRDVSEVVESQSRMLKRLGRKGADISQEKLTEIFTKERDRCLRRLAADPKFDVLTVDYVSVLKFPEKESRHLCDFLSEDLDFTAMAAAVDPELRSVC